MKPFLFWFILGYGVAVGYTVGKFDLDQKIARMVKAGTTEFIAYAKSVPPAIPDGYRQPTAKEIREMSDEDLINGRLVKA